jgi:hypothetical protein
MIRGATYQIEITINSDDTGLPVNLSSVQGILVALYGDGGRIYGKWSLVDKSAEGFGDVTIENAANGVISVPVEVDYTKKSLLKMSKLEVKLAFNNPDFEDGLQVSIDTDIDIEEIESSVFEGISPI